MLSPNILKSIALTILTLGIGNTPLLGQVQDDPHGRKVFGYQDSATGVFHPLPAEVPDPNTVAPTTGTLKVVLNITVKSTWPTGSTRIIICSSDFGVSAVTATSMVTSYVESRFVYATGSGTAFSCTMTIPYSWLIPTPTLSRALTGTYEVSVENSTAAAGPPLLRLNGGNIVSTSTLPVNGATTTYTFSVTI